GIIASEDISSFNTNWLDKSNIDPNEAKLVAQFVYGLKVTNAQLAKIPKPLGRKFSDVLDTYNYLASANLVPIDKLVLLDFLGRSVDNIRPKADLLFSVCVPAESVVKYNRFLGSDLAELQSRVDILLDFGFTKKQIGKNPLMLCNSSATLGKKLGDLQGFMTYGAILKMPELLCCSTALVRDKRGFLLKFRVPEETIEKNPKLLKNSMQNFKWIFDFLWNLGVEYNTIFSCVSVLSSSRTTIQKSYLALLRSLMITTGMEKPEAREYIRTHPQALGMSPESHVANELFVHATGIKPSNGMFWLTLPAKKNEKIADIAKTFRNSNGRNAAACIFAKGNGKDGKECAAAKAASKGNSDGMAGKAKTRQEIEAEQKDIRECVKKSVEFVKSRPRVLIYSTKSYMDPNHRSNKWIAKASCPKQSVLFANGQGK
ncbi:MAG TPA: hypothetical protein PLO51_03005, partial [Candidatus Micrarchaeota archaeon]|nr:hypothetical protein [Candidatus Micrarchaeota archaeon]